MRTYPFLCLAIQFAHGWLRTSCFQALPYAAALAGFARARSRATDSYLVQRVVYFGLMVALVLTSQAARAQDEPALRTNTSLATVTQGARDTIAAIQQVFKSRRRGGTMLLAGSAALISVATVGTALEATPFLGPDGAALLFAIGTSPAWVVGLLKQVRFNAKRERRVVADYQRDHRIPSFICRRIRLAK